MTLLHNVQEESYSNSQLSYLPPRKVAGPPAEHGRQGESKDHTDLRREVMCCLCV